MFGGAGKIKKVILGNFTREQNGFWGLEDQRGAI